MIELARCGTGPIMFDPNILHQWVKHYSLSGPDPSPSEKNKIILGGMKLILYLSAINLKT